MNIIAHDVKGLKVGQREEDGYIHATALAKAYFEQTGIRKDVRDWLNTDRAKEYAELLSVKTGIPVSLLIQKKRGGNTQGTWLHPKLATPFGTWLSVEYEFQVSEWVEQWMLTGKNPIASEPEPKPTPKPPFELPPMPQPPEMVMPSPEHINFMKQPGAMNDPEWKKKGNWDKAFEAARQYRQYEEDLIEWRKLKRKHEAAIALMSAESDSDSPAESGLVVSVVVGE